MNQELKDLHRPSVLRWLLLAGRWLEIILALVVAGYLNHPLIYLLVWVFLGTRLLGLALLGHEAIYRNICRNKALNDFLGNFLCALPLNQDKLCGTNHPEYENHYRSVKARTESGKTSRLMKMMKL